MVKGFPRYNFLAERLRDHGDHQLFNTYFWKTLNGNSHL